MRLNHLDILEHCFREKFRGYSKEEVDAFLHLVSDDFREMAEEIEALKQDALEKDRLIAELRNSNPESASVDIDGLREKAKKVIQLAKNEAEKHRQNAEEELAALKSDIHKLSQEKSRLVQSIKESLRDHLKK